MVSTIFQINRIFANQGGGDTLLLPHDLSQNPTYQGYRFGRTHTIVNIGIQPLWLPGAVVTEVMKRDQVLHDDMAALKLEVRFHPFLKGADVNYFLHHGDLEGGIGGDMPTITACATLQVRVVSLFDLNFTSIVANKPMLLTELAGKRIGFAFGSNAHYALLHAFSAVGITESDAQLLPMDVDVMPDAFFSGKVDAFSAWEPTPTICTINHNSKIIHRSLASGYMYFSKGFSEKQSAAVRALVTAQIRALTWLHQSHENKTTAIHWMLKAIASLTGKPAKISVKASLPLINASLRILARRPIIPMDDISQNGRIHRAVQFLRAIGKIPKKTTWNHIRACFKRNIVLELLTSFENTPLKPLMLREGSSP